MKNFCRLGRLDRCLARTNLFVEAFLALGVIGLVADPMVEVKDLGGEGPCFANDSCFLKAEDKIGILVRPSEQGFVISADRKGIIPPAGHVAPFDPAPDKLTVISPTATTQFQKDGEDLVDASLEAEEGKPVAEDAKIPDSSSNDFLGERLAQQDAASGDHMAIFGQ